MVQENPDLFFIAETKIKIKYPKAKGWSIEYKRRAKKEFEGGGVGIMIKDEIRKNIEIYREEDLDDFMGIRIKSMVKDTVFFVIYSPTDNKNREERENFYEEVENRIRKLTIFINTVTSRFFF